METEFRLIGDWWSKPGKPKIFRLKARVNKAQNFISSLLISRKKKQNQQENPNLTLNLEPLSHDLNLHLHLDLNLSHRSRRPLSPTGLDRDLSHRARSRSLPPVTISISPADPDLSSICLRRWVERGSEIPSNPTPLGLHNAQLLYQLSMTSYRGIHLRRSHPFSLRTNLSLRTILSHLFAIILLRESCFRKRTSHLLNQLRRLSLQLLRRLNLNSDKLSRLNVWTHFLQVNRLQFEHLNRLTVLKHKILVFQKRRRRICPM